MLLSIVFFGFIFVYAAFLSGVLPDKNWHPLATYLYFQGDFLIRNLLVFVSGAGILFWFLYKNNRNVILSSFKVIIVIVSSLFFSYLLLIIVALVQLNSLSLLAYLNPKIIGLETNRDNIVKRLENTRRVPIIASNMGYDRNDALAVAVALSGKNNFYGKFVLTSMPSSFIVPFENKEVRIMMIDNLLIFNTIDQSDLELISPYIGHLFVKEFFPMKRIRAYPKVLLLEPDVYIKYRKQDIFESLNLLDEKLAQLEELISSLSARMESEEYVNNPVDDPKLLDKYKAYAELYRNQIMRGEVLIENAGGEFGVFVPLNTIRIVARYESKTEDHQKLAEYFASLAHEYLHYTSYVPDKAFSTVFFEEGFTEYFAGLIVKDVLGARTSMGYKAHTAIIREMTNLITESEFEHIYFTKDEDGLREALDRVYGDGFYQKNLLIFDRINYASSIEDKLDLANNIMKQIGGDPLSEVDLTGAVYEYD